VFYGNLSQHIGLYCPKNPNRQRAYHCCYCKFRSLDRASLVEHKTTHVLARDHKCEICDSSFFTRQRLVRHMRYVHLLGTNPVRIYTCDRCGKRFRYHSHYERHLTIHSGKYSVKTICQHICFVGIMMTFHLKSVIYFYISSVHV
jgi:KRAB domain-containing zinc finger protein